MSHKEAYIEFCNTHDVPLFHQPFWWDCVAPNWEVQQLSENDAKAFLPYQLEKKLGFSLARNPHLTPYSGLLFEKNNYSTEQKQNLLNMAISFLQKNSLVELDCNPQLCHEINAQKNKTTFLLSLDNPLDIIFKNFKSSLRRQLRKAEKSLSIKEITNTDLFFEIYAETIQSKERANKIPKEMIETVFTSCLEKGIGNIFAAVDKEENVHAGIFYVEDKHTAYYLLGGSRRKFLGSGAMGFLLWHCIQLAHANGKKVFDFEGSEDPGVARFFSTFGGAKTTYPVLKIPTNSFLTTILKLKNMIG